MGSNTSALLSEEIEEISRQANLPPLEVKKLYKRFQKLDRTQSGTLNANDLLMVPELAMNPLHPRLLSIFENVNFTQFVNNLSAFSPSSPPEKKVDFAFRIYDLDGDGYISEEDLSGVLQMLVGEYMDTQTIERVVTGVLKENDLDRDGRISREEFASGVDVLDLARRLTVSI